MDQLRSQIVDTEFDMQEGKDGAAFYIGQEEGENQQNQITSDQMMQVLNLQR